MARNKNYWVGTGRLGADPEVRTTQTGVKVAHLRLACSRNWKDKDGNDKANTFWAPIVAWGLTAEICEKYCRKGDLIRAEGPLTNREWQDKNGNKRFSIEVTINGFSGEIEFLSSPKRDESSPSQQSSSSRQSSKESQWNDEPLDDEIPF
ncbi:single-stranded DNA-binding protein [Saccharibacter sp. 17.LH.SD]|uniref:single-stranded DNA-binding protein n=1 Tax=Saccharibacter sp. 17.LH.SD TaxID=2689393 RepID=UPI00136BFC59|nr:single-stranded DNA-binding protein [Saccharibacter sp. 17.LH.SD]MXV43491.1 single-stranded DNA-binding protein [Saccharibacter sp. 17.LH.SD]